MSLSCCRSDSLMAAAQQACTFLIDELGALPPTADLELEHQHIVFMGLLRCCILIDESATGARQIISALMSDKATKLQYLSCLRRRRGLHGLV